MLRFAVVRTTGTNDAKEARVVCSGIQAGEIVVFDGKLVAMVFLTNNMEWAPASICDLYKRRWGIDVFFKQLKQGLQLADFLGHRESAIRWQVWTALLAYFLLRLIAYAGHWGHALARLFTLLRGVLWECLDLFGLLELCGTAKSPSTGNAECPERKDRPGKLRNRMQQPVPRLLRGGGVQKYRITDASTLCCRTFWVASIPRSVAPFTWLPQRNS